MDTPMFKEDIKAARERMAAWWDGELLDRPVMGYHCARMEAQKTIVWNGWYLADPARHDDANGFADHFEASIATLKFGGDLLPNLFVNYGPGIMASVLGCPPKFLSNTVWFERETPTDKILPLLESARLDGNNEWYARLLRVTEVLAKRAGDRYSVSVTDLGGVLDVLASFIPPAKLIVLMRRDPGLVDACRAVILEKLVRVQADLQAITLKHNGGTNGWLNVWCPKRWYPLQCDFAAMLSPKWFERFVLPDLVAQAESLDYAIYHLDGPDQLKYLDMLLAEPAIHGIQWVPGAGQKPMCDPAWYPVYRKIEAAGKKMVSDASSERLLAMYEKFDPKLLFLTTFFPNELWGDFWLPEFMGGMGGKDEDEA